jgi:hypothetical protein
VAGPVVVDAHADRADDAVVDDDRELVRAEADLVVDERPRVGERVRAWDHRDPVQDVRVVDRGEDRGDVALAPWPQDHRLTA